MGNEQSSSDTNIPSSHSFLLNKRSDAKTKSKIIVVKQKTNTVDSLCSKNDDIIKRFMDIPKFYPILKSSLNHPGLRDPPEAVFKVSPLPMLKFAYRLQEHLSRCASIVMDHDIALLLVHFGDRKRSMDHFQNYSEKIIDLQAHISNLQLLFQDLIPMAQTLNDILPEQKRLPLLDIDYRKNITKYSLEVKRNEIIREIESGTGSIDNNQDDLHIRPIDEVADFSKIQKPETLRELTLKKINDLMSFIGMDIDVFQVKPLRTKQIVAFVNYFLVRNVQMLQDFVSNMEWRIVDMEKRLNRVEVELELLELKLDSVPGLQMIVPKANESSAKQQYDSSLFNQITMEDTLKDGTVEHTKIVDSKSLFVPSSLISVEKPHKFSMEQNHCLHIRDDPRYAIYFKMLKMGVPECAVKQKMKSQGIDTVLLQTPDAFSDLPEDVAISIEGKGSTSADDDQNSTSSSDR
ncbi:unnamed protein product [Onchocerca ochengi]|uniref:BLOC-1-related complex subunit 5 n=1 Tax=Onchocerca ochengi TaxID=42157 RepID=A0A182EET9_ONCOC|nr:unnamed protein product [Onchocerca ochengi]